VDNSTRQSLNPSLLIMTFSITAFNNSGCIATSSSNPSSALLSFSSETFCFLVAITATSFSIRFVVSLFIWNVVLLGMLTLVIWEQNVSGFAENKSQ
jgi:hypothetical protein